MAITIAPSSTASPASWPPISRGSSGSVAEAGTALMWCGFAAPWVVAGGLGVPGVTVGKRLPGFPGLASSPGTPGVPGSPVRPGRLGTGSVGMVPPEADEGEVGDGDVLRAVALIRTEAAAWNEVAPCPVAVAVSRTFLPVVAPRATLTAARSSSDWPVGRLPILQAVPFADGQTVYRAALTFASLLTTAETDTFLAAAAVLQTQMT